MKVFPPFFGRPTNKAVTAANMTRRRGKGNTGHHCSKGKDQILEVCPNRLAISQVVILLDEAVEQFLGGCSSHLPDPKGPYPGKRPFKGGLINGCFGGLLSLGKGIGRVVFLFRQPDLTGPVKLKH